MGIFGTLFGCKESSGTGKKPTQYVTESAFQSNLAMQSAMTPETLGQLRNYGVTDTSSLKLEYFFYTNDQNKADSLAKLLGGLGYEVDIGPSSSDEQIILVTGWTVPLKMDEKTVVNWTQEMVNVGYKSDCEFDGWGTNPNQ